MTNDPRSEPYYDYLMQSGYQFFNYSEKHYIFEKGKRVIKVAKNICNNAATDESYYIEKAAHELLLFHHFPVVKIYNVYSKGDFLEDFVVLEEEKVDGKVYYKKNCENKFLTRVLHLMQNATSIKGKKFGMMDKDGQAKFSSWKECLYSVAENMPEDERKSCCRNIETLPEVKEPSFVFTDCNMANFVFSGDSLIKAIDVERPLWGDPSFLYGVIKSRNPYLYALIGKEAESEIVDLYAKIYPYIFCG